MKRKLLFATVAIACFNSYATPLTQDLTNHAFILKNSYNEQERCLSRTDDNSISFESCFVNKIHDRTEINKALNQLVTFENNRLFSANNSGSYNQYCLRATGQYTAQWDAQCNDKSSEFEVVPFTGPSTDLKTNHFQLKNKKFTNSCLSAYGNGNSHLFSCDNAYALDGEYFSTPLKTPMIPIQASNLTSKKHDVTLEIRDTNDNLLYFKTLKNAKKSDARLIYYPDYQSYLQESLVKILRANNTRFGSYDFSYIRMRASDAGEFVIKDRAVQFNKTEGEAITINSQTGGINRDEFVFTKDQISLKPYAGNNLNYILPDGWVAALYDKENFSTTDNSLDNMTIRFSSDNESPAGALYASTRITYENNGKTFKINNEKGGLIWKKTGTTTHLALQGIGDNVTPSKNYVGFFGKSLAIQAFWRKGSVFCERSTPTPSCAMLKTDISAKGIPFTNTKHWFPFTFKQYQAKQDIDQGELFYHRGSAGLEAWYAKKSGKLGEIPSNRKENNEWYYMGLYEGIIIGS